MCVRRQSLVVAGVLTLAAVSGCAPTDSPAGTERQTVASVQNQEKGGQELYGHFEPVEG